MMIKLAHCLPLIGLTFCLSCTPSEPQKEVPDDPTLANTQQDPIYLFLAGEIGIDREDYAHALEYYIKLVKENPDPLLAARATSLALEQNNDAVAAQMAHLWADGTPEDIQTQAIAASLFLKTGCESCAIPYLKKVLLPSDTESLQYLTLIDSALENKNSETLYSHALETVGIELKDTRALFMAAQMNYELGESTQAIQILDNLDKIKPNWIRAQTLRMQIWYENKEPHKAISYLQAMIQKEPNNHALQWLIARMFIENNQAQQSVPYLKSLLQDKNYQDEAALELTRYLIQAGDIKAAKVYLSQYTSRNPATPEAYFLSGYIDQEEGQFQKALEKYTQIQQGPYYFNSRIQMVFIDISQAKYDQALSLTDTLLNEFPQEHKQIELVKIQVLLAAHRFNDAIQNLNTILSKNNTDSELIYIRGLVQLEVSNNAAAEKDFKTVLSQNPNHLGSHNALTQIFIEKGDLQSAQQHLSFAQKIAPQNPDVLDNQGWLEFKQGHTEAAIQILQEAFQKSPNGDFAAHLGEALWKFGKEREAMMVWNAGLKIDPSNALLIQTMKLHLIQPALQ